MKAGIGGFFSILFLIGLTVFTGVRTLHLRPDDDLSAVILTATLYVVMHFIFACVDISWTAQSMVYVGTMMGLVNSAERIGNLEATKVTIRIPELGNACNCRVSGTAISIENSNPVSKSTVTKSYAIFGLQRSFRQVLHALRCRRNSAKDLLLSFRRLLEQEQLIAQRLGKPLRHLKILEVGPGQSRERAHYFGIYNDVTAIDSDVIPYSLDLVGYLRMIKENGLGRFVKTLGRRLVLGRVYRAGWTKVVGSDEMREPHVVHGDICTRQPPKEAFDVVMSWSVMEHLADPESALRHMVRALRPGGVLFVSIHLYTCNSGHHDIRAFTGQEDTLPLWGHLRSSTQHLVTASAFLNRWRLSEWRALFSLATPGCEERLETYDNSERYGSLMTNALRHELSEYRDEELFTVDAIYVWKKPLNTGEEPPCMVQDKE